MENIFHRDKGHNKVSDLFNKVTNYKNKNLDNPENKFFLRSMSAEPS